MLRDAIAAHFAKIGARVSVKYIDPSYMIRSVPANASDSIFCDSLARHAVHAGMAGKTDLVIFRPATGLWAIHGSSGTDTFVTYGIGTDTPIPADYDGDGKTDIAIFRPEYGTWWIHRSSDGTDVAITFGINTDVPVPADYDGDGRADAAVVRLTTGQWFVLNSSGGSTAEQWGGGAFRVPGDYDFNHVDDFAVVTASGRWAIRR